MKITSVECYLADGGLGGFVTVKVNTDEGISGFGEAGLAYGKCSEAAFGQCQDFAKMVIGMDPFNTEEIWEHLHRHTFWGMGGGVVVTSAMAAIDTACWDIKGKALNVPVYKLIGGKTNKKLRAYASQLQFGWRTLIEKNDALTLLYDPQDYYDVVKDAVAEGYDAVKIDPVFAPLEDAGMAPFATQGNQIRGCYREHDLKRSVERIAAAREAGGPDLDIIVEIHSLLDANTAAILGATLGRQVPDLIGPDIPDGDGNIHTGIVAYPVPILKGNGALLKELRRKLCNPQSPEYRELVTVDFTETAQRCLHYEDYTGKLAGSKEEDLHYLGIGLCGNKKLVNKLTGSLPLLR